MKLVYTMILTVFSLSLSAQDLSICEGEWRGKLEIYNEKGFAQALPMGLNIVKEDSTWKWQMMYNEGPQVDFRDYTLLPTENPSQFILDEHNGILLAMSLINNTFFSLFELNGTILMISYSLENEQMVFRTQFSADGNPLNSGAGTEDSPSVIARRVTSSQIGYLEKK
jgi:hypothetical protein